MMVAVESPSALTFCATETPSMPGILMSSRATSGLSSRIISQAFTPSSASPTRSSELSRRKNSAMPALVRGWSSAKTILTAIDIVPFIHT